MVPENSKPSCRDNAEGKKEKKNDLNQGWGEIGDAEGKAKCHDDVVLEKLRPKDNPKNPWFFGPRGEEKKGANPNKRKQSGRVGGEVEKGA